MPYFDVVAFVASYVASVLITFDTGSGWRLGGSSHAVAPETISTPRQRGAKERFMRRTGCKADATVRLVHRCTEIMPLGGCVAPRAGANRRNGADIPPFHRGIDRVGGG